MIEMGIFRSAILQADRCPAARQMVGLHIVANLIAIDQRANERGIDRVGRHAIADRLYPFQIAIICVRFIQAASSHRSRLVRPVIGQAIGTIIGHIAPIVIGPTPRAIYRIGNLRHPVGAVIRNIDRAAAQLELL